MLNVEIFLINTGDKTFTLLLLFIFVIKSQLTLLYKNLLKINWKSMILRHYLSTEI